MAAVALTLAVVAGCTGEGGDSAEARAGAAARTFLDRLAAGDLARAARATDAPADARAVLGHTWDALQVSRTTYSLTGEATCRERRCTQPVRLAHRLAGLGRWSYAGLVTVDRPTGSPGDGGTYDVHWSPRLVHPRLTPGTVLTRTRELPERASILDRDGRRLTRNGEVARIGVVPEKVRSETYPDLRDLLDIDPAGLRESVRAAEPDWFVPVITLRASDYRPVADALLEVPGVAVDRQTWSLTPTSTWGRALLGSVAPATAETLESAGPWAAATDVVGASGLQLRYQRQLAGRPGGRVAVVDARTDAEVATVHRVRARRGVPVRTTVDRRTQQAAERAVQTQSKPTALVAVHAPTGEVLASAVGPGIQSYNTAFVGQYPPGSTFKVLSAAALLQQDAVRLDEPARCPATLAVDGKSFKNYDDFRPLPPDASFADAFAASCNTAIVGRSGALGDSAMRDTAVRFGLTEEWDLGVEAFSGSVPVAESEVDRAASMIGQGRVLMSPLAMAMVAAAVGTGRPVAPSLVRDGGGAAPAGAAGEPLPGGLARSLRALMRRVVTQGTATGLDLPGAPVHAKTGTAELDSDDPSRTLGWMIGFRGDVAFAVLVEDGSSGTQDAAPVVRTFLGALPGFAA